jgi:hypothetical protein
MTMFWQGKNSKAVLIFIPGGEGYIGFKEGQTEASKRSQFAEFFYVRVDS